MLKVLLATPRVSGVGGIAQHVRQLAKRLRWAGYEVKVISSETMGLSLRKGLANPAYALIAPLKSLKERYDIVHGHNLPSAAIVKLAKANVRILTLHGIYSRQIGLLYGRTASMAAEVLEKWSLKHVDAVTAVSLEAAKHYRSFGFKTFHIPNAIDLSEMPEEAERISDPQITYLGRLSKEKGVDLLVKASIMGLKGIVIAGDGPLRPLIKYAASHHLLTFLGPLPRKKALKILAGSDVLVLPSREEGISTVLLEAMALRKPVVATKVGGTLEVVRSGKEGVLIDPSAEAIFKAVNEVLSDNNYARNLGENAYQKVIKEYSWDVVQRKYFSLYDELVAN